MTAHNAPEWDDPRTVEAPTGRLGATALVVLAVVAGLTLVLMTLVLTHAAEQAESIAVLAMLLGTGLAIGFRKRWNHR